MGRRSVRATWILCASLVLGSAAQAQDALDMERASARFDRGLALVEQGAYAQAVGEFELAHSLSGDASVLYNLGMAYVAAGRPVEAIAALTRYLAQADGVPAPERQRVEVELQRQRSRVGTLEVTLRPAGARLRVDAREASPPDGLLVLAPGEHSVEATHPGYGRVQRSVHVLAQQRAALSIELPPEPALMPAQPAPARSRTHPARRDERDGSNRRRAGYVSGVLGLASGLTALSLYLCSHARFQTWSREDQRLERRYDAGAEEDPQLAQRQADNDDLLRSVWKMDDAAAALGIAGGALVALGGVLLWTAKGEGRKLRLRTTLRGNQLALSGRF